MPDRSGFALLASRDGRDDRYELAQDRVLIGRSRVAHPDIQVADPEAGPRACALEWDAAAGTHRLVVIGRNGLTLNGAFVGSLSLPVVLRPGDRFAIGRTVFTYVAARRATGGDGVS